MPYGQRCNSQICTVRIISLKKYCLSIESIMTISILMLLLLVDVASARSRYYDNDLIVKTAKGKVRGFVSRSPNRRLVDSYLGIPYAKPPLGEYRFRHPKPIDPWDGIYNATKLPNSCYQIIDEFYGKDFSGSKIWNPNTPMNEDCLYLNVWVPHPRPKKKKLTVMVWIFGGGFYSGTSTLDIYDGRILASEENVIVVSMNYRIASLGFLYLGNRPEAPGNAGLFDQVMALEWVRDNIAYFGGSPSNVTIFGESAGAASCSYHLVSSLSQNLFQYAILQSGSMLAHWAVTDKEEIERRAINLARVFECSEESYDTIIECLRKIHPSKLVNSEFVDYGVVEFPFTPIIDGVFLDESPESAMNNGNFKKTNILAGSNTDEGYYYAMYFLDDLLVLEEDVGVSRDEFIKSVRRFNPYLNNISINAIVFQYTDWSQFKNPAANRNMIDKIVGDYNFHCPVSEFVTKYSEDDQNVYVYYYTHRYSTHPYPKWTGVLHGDEIFIVFGDPLKASKGYQKSEVQFSKMVMRYWANFAKTGNPNIGPRGRYSNSVHWKPHSFYNREYLVLETKPRMEERGVRLRECAFWREYLPQLLPLRIAPMINGKKPIGEVNLIQSGNEEVSDNAACPVVKNNSVKTCKEFSFSILLIIITQILRNVS